jgi:hypothetical protein
MNATQAITKFSAAGITFNIMATSQDEANATAARFVELSKPAYDKWLTICRGQGYRSAKRFVFEGQAHSELLKSCLLFKTYHNNGCVVDAKGDYVRGNVINAEGRFAFIKRNLENESMFTVTIK